MLPILYDKTGNTRIGELTDCIKGYVIEERNGRFEAEITYSIFSPLWDKLILENIFIADANDTLKNQKFRIYRVSKPISGRFTVYAQHISYDLMKDVVEDMNIEMQSCEYCLNQIFRSSQFSQHYRGYSDIVNSQNFKITSTKVLKAIGGTNGSIIDTFGTGAEILRDNENIHVLNKRGHDNDVVIEYGKNLTGIELVGDNSKLITRIKGYAKHNDENGNEVVVYTTPKYIDSPYILNYATPYIDSIDFSDKFEEDEIPTSAKLKTLVEKYFIESKCDIPNEDAKISFIPLSKCKGYENIQDKISLCDTVTIKDYRYNYETKIKVVKATYDFLRERYESVEVGEPRTTLGNIISGTGSGQKGDKGDKGDKGEPGADGNIGDFPDSLPETPILSSKLYGFANIELSWTFENKVYYSYQLYASKTRDFIPNVFDLIHEGQSSSFLFQAKPEETWYFRVCCVNSHGNRTEFSNQIAVTTTKIDDLSNYVGEMAIGESLIGTLSLDRGWYGELRGNYIDAKQLSVTDGNGKRTLWIDSFGNVNLDVTSLKISSKGVATEEYSNNLLVEAKKYTDSLETEVSQEITPSGILSKVNTQIAAGGEIETVAMLLNYLGLTIKNGAFIIQNKAGDVVWSADDNGNMIMRNGNFYIESTNGYEIASINQNNWMRIQGIEIFGHGECMRNIGSGARSLIINSTDGNTCYLDFNRGANETYGTRIAREGNTRTLSMYASSVTMQCLMADSPMGLELRSRGGVSYIDLSTDIAADYRVRLFAQTGDNNLHVTGGLVLKRSSSLVSGEQHVLRTHSSTNISAIDSIGLNTSEKFMQICPMSGSTVWAATIWQSDESLKKNIVELDNETISTLALEEEIKLTGLELIKAIKHYEFDFKDNSEHVSCGYISQQLKELNEELVLGVAQGDGSTLYQPREATIIPNLSKAIQEQQSIIESQQSKINDLEERLKTLENLILNK